jgi:hypothetical protein
MAVVQAAIALAISLGFDLTADTVAAIMALTAGVLSLFVRERVSPVERSVPRSSGSARPSLPTRSRPG